MKNTQDKGFANCLSKMSLKSILIVSELQKAAPGRTDIQHVLSPTDDYATWSLEPHKVNTIYRYQVNSI